MTNAFRSVANATRSATFFCFSNFLCFRFLLLYIFHIFIDFERLYYLRVCEFLLLFCILLFILVEFANFLFLVFRDNDGLVVQWLLAGILSIAD